ncbi:MAG: amidohydrolase, partial [Flavobacteriaceae bacterium]|nr:amidohydrolase [Flavobacteriaceae bacterium]
MKKFKYICLAFILFLSFNSKAQQTPAEAQKEAITITGATAHLGNGKVIENSIITFENGKITAVADANTAKISGSGKVIDAAGKHVYPGFITANSSLGLIEVNAVRASNDSDEIGDLLPHIRSLIAYNAESKVVESMRPNGVLLA